MLKSTMRAIYKRHLLLATTVVLGLFIVPFSTVLANSIVTNEYYINHQSIEPVYKENNLDPTVLIHVREVVLQGRERTAPSEGKVLLFVHGAVTPGYIGFDANCEDCSMMRSFAMAGWDTFTLDYEGFGLSTRSPVMKMPQLFPGSPTPTRTEVAIGNIARVVEFIRNLRGVRKVHLLGWSFGATRSAPMYALRHPDTVAKLVLFAPAYRDLGRAEELREQVDTFKNLKVLTSYPSMERWVWFGGKVENFRPGALEMYRVAVFASDPESGELGGGFRFPAGPLVDILEAKTQFDAVKIIVPTLVIRGANDTYGSREDSQALMDDLGAKVKEFVEIPEGSHYLPLERANIVFIKTIRKFLDARVE